LIEGREQEITNIVKSIEELATIFKDLAVLVVDQGTVLDRIDWNLQQSETHIVAGREELQQGEKYQKSASKKYLIILLCLIVLGMILGLIISQKAKKK
jgi:syntaxin 16